MTDMQREAPEAPGPRGHFLLGNLPDVQRGPLTFLTGLAREYGGVARYRFVHMTGFLISEPEYVKHILVDNNRAYSKDNFSYNLLKSVVGEGLLTSDGDLWLRQRRMMQPAFHRRRIAAFGCLMTDTTEELLKRWKVNGYAHQSFDVSQEMMRLTLAIVGKALFSQDISSEADLVGSAFTIANEHISHYFRRLFPPPLSWPTPSNRRFHRAVAQLERVVDGIVRERREALQSKAEVSGDLLTHLMQARTEQGGEGMTDRQLRDEIMTLLLAGHETTANALSWTWYLLSQNPGAEKCLHDELDGALGGRTPTTDDLPNLPYTRMVFQESMRLYPPAWIISRTAEQDDEIGGYRIPKGSVLNISTYVVHRHPKHWKDPEQFDPLRFTGEREAGRHPYAYFPFGGGARLCIGRDFAMVEGQLILAMIAQKCRLVLEADAQVTLEPLITLRPHPGVPVRLQWRSGKASG